MSKRGNHGGKAEHREKKLAIKSDVKNVQKQKLLVESAKQYRIFIYHFDSITRRIKHSGILTTKRITKNRAEELAKIELKGYSSNDVCYDLEVL